MRSYLETGRVLLTAALITLGVFTLGTAAAACGPEPGAASQQAGDGDEALGDTEGRPDESADAAGGEEGQEEPEATPLRQPGADVQKTIAWFKELDPGISKFFDSAAGYVVYPNIGKAGLGIGGAHGNGEVIGKDAGAIGKSSITQVTVGVQIGGQEYSEVIFFESELDLERFKTGSLELAAQVSAVAITAGAADGANYKDGVAVFTRTKSGMMGEASVGGQKFSYNAY